MRSSPQTTHPVAGALPLDEQIAFLRALGDTETANVLERALEEAQTRETFSHNVNPFGLFSPLAWQHTDHAFGYIPPLAPDGPLQDTLAIQDIGTLKPDKTLQGDRIKMVLSHMHIHNYPGGGEYRILLDFSAQNQVPGGAAESLHYNATFRVRKGESAAVRNFPIFIGLNVGANGAQFECKTAVVGSSRDDALLKTLESQVFKGGLQLMATAQPALAPLSALAEGVASMLSDNNRDRANAPVQDIKLGLDFAYLAGGAALAEGSYIALQIADNLKTVWDWKKYVLHTSSSRLVQSDNPAVGVPYNYLIFSISRYQQENS